MCVYDQDGFSYPNIIMLVSGGSSDCTSSCLETNGSENDDGTHEHQSGGDRDSFVDVIRVFYVFSASCVVCG